MTPLQTPQWILVKLVPLANGKTDKLPCDWRTTMVTLKDGQGAHNPAIWTTYDNARAVAAALPGHTVGFVLTKDDPFFCVDIDGALRADGQDWTPLAYEIMQALPGCMIEISQSGKGLHIWGSYPSPPPHRKKRIDLGVELYTEARFIAWGTNPAGTIAERCDALPAFIERYFKPAEVSQENTPDEGPRADWRGPTDDDELLRRAMQSRSAAAAFGGKASFSDLFTGNVEVLARAYPADPGSHEPFDRSSADAALASHLAFWTGCDVARIERLMRISALKRDKWDQRQDYLVERTIRNACRVQKDVLQDKPVVSPVGPPPPPPLASPFPTDAPVAAGIGVAEGATILSPEQQRTLFNGCVYVVDQHRVLVPGGKLLKPEQFKALFGGYSFVMDSANSRVSRNAFEALTESQALRAPKVDNTCFRPQLPYGAIVDTGDGRKLANKFWPVYIRRQQGDVTPYLMHLEKLYPDQYERDLIRFTQCGLAQYQGYKMQWMPILQGVEGNGKTWLAAVLKHVLGARYVYWPRADKLTKDFNGWLEGGLLFVVEEIYVPDHKLEIVETLKPMITSDNGLEIERKGVDQSMGDVCGNFWGNTNHKNAIKKTKNDRRFCMLFSAQQTVEDLARDKMGGEYMHGLYAWLRKPDSVAALAHYLHTTKIPREFDFTQDLQRAPETRSTSLALAESFTAREQEVMDAIEREEIGFRGGWVSSHFLDKLLDRTGQARFCPINQRRALMQSLGYDWHPGLALGRVNNPVMPDGLKVKLFVRLDSEAARLTGAAAIAEAYAKAQGVAR